MVIEGLTREEILLVIVEVPLTCLLVPIAVSFGLLVAELVLLAILFVGLIGYSLIHRVNLKQSLRNAVKVFFAWIIVISIPWIVVFPVELQIVSVSLLGLGIAIAFLYVYYRIVKPLKTKLQNKKKKK